MTPKERAAMKLALEALELHLNGCGVAIATRIAYDALRGALDHSGEANEMVGCAYCNNPLFAGTKCNNCGHITLAEQADGEQWSPDDMAYRPSGLSMEQAEQEPFDMDDHPPHRLCECRKCMEYFTPLPDCDAFAASGKPIIEQEPMYISESCAERGCACHYSVEVDGEPVAVYSAPVRTKDLTDDEIYQLADRELRYLEESYEISGAFDFARAVIAADREKNK